jgi:hypothetical protein
VAMIEVVSVIIGLVVVALVLGVAGLIGALLAQFEPDHRNPLLRWLPDWYERSHRGT